MRQISKIGIVGGSFDPPTIAHLKMAEVLLADKKVDKIIFVPCGSRSDKQLQSGFHRAEMLSKAVQDFFPIQKELITIDLLEIQNGQMMQTYQMLHLMKQKYQTDDLYFIIGWDLLRSIGSWGEAEKLLKEFKFIAFNREDGQNHKEIHKPDHLEIIEQFHQDISSTFVRKIIKESKNTLQDDLKGKLTQSVINYIINNNLYM